MASTSEGVDVMLDAVSGVAATGAAVATAATEISAAAASATARARDS